MIILLNLLFCIRTFFYSAHFVSVVLVCYSIESIFLQLIFCVNHFYAISSFFSFFSLLLPSFHLHFVIVSIFLSFSLYTHCRGLWKKHTQFSSFLAFPFIFFWVFCLFFCYFYFRFWRINNTYKRPQRRVAKECVRVAVESFFVRSSMYFLIVVFECIVLVKLFCFLWIFPLQ